MEKAATIAYPIHDLLVRRWSPRAFAGRHVEPEKLCSLFEAARWSASCFNAQPWRFIVATKDNPPEYERLLGCLVEFNQNWARAAPVLVLTVAQMQFEHDGTDNVHAWHDVGLATQNLILQATSLGLSAHAMAGFSADKARAAYTIPPGYEPVAALALGYVGDPDTLPKDLRKKEHAPRERKVLSNLVFSGRWGQGWPLVGR